MNRGSQQVSVPIEDDGAVNCPIESDIGRKDNRMSPTNNICKQGMGDGNGGSGTLNCGSDPKKDINANKSPNLTIDQSQENSSNSRARNRIILPKILPSSRYLQRERYQREPTPSAESYESTPPMPSAKSWQSMSSASIGDDVEEQSKMLDFGLYQPPPAEVKGNVSMDVKRQDERDETKTPTSLGRENRNLVKFHLGSDSDTENEELEIEPKNSFKVDDAKGNGNWTDRGESDERGFGNENGLPFKDSNGIARVDLNLAEGNHDDQGRDIESCVGVITTIDNMEENTESVEMVPSAKLDFKDMKTADNNSENVYHNQGNSEIDNNVVDTVCDENFEIKNEEDNVFLDITDQGKVLTNNKNGGEVTTDDKTGANMCGVFYNKGVCFDKSPEVFSSSPKTSATRRHSTTDLYSPSREPMIMMKGGMRRFRRRSQMSLSPDLPIEIPAKARRNQNDNRNRDNLEYLKRRISIQEEKDVFVTDDPRVKECMKFSSSVVSERNTTSMAYENKAFAHSESSLSPLTPKELNHNSTVFDFNSRSVFATKAGSRPAARRRSDGSSASLSSVRWEDLEIEASQKDNGMAENVIMERVENIPEENEATNVTEASFGDQRNDDDDDNRRRHDQQQQFHNQRRRYGNVSRPVPAAECFEHQQNGNGHRDPNRPVGNQSTVPCPSRSDGIVILEDERTLEPHVHTKLVVNDGNGDRRHGFKG